SRSTLTMAISSSTTRTVGVSSCCSCWAIVTLPCPPSATHHFPSSLSRVRAACRVRRGGRHHIVIIRSTFVHHRTPCLLNSGPYHETCEPVTLRQRSAATGHRMASAHKPEREGGGTTDAFAVWGSVVGLVVEILLVAGLIVALVERKERTMSLRTSLRAAGGARLDRRRAVILGAALWVGLFGVEMSVVPPWGARERPATHAPTAVSSGHVWNAALAHE